MTLTQVSSTSFPAQIGAYSLKTYTGSDPAGTGAEVTESVPAGKAWRLLAFKITLVTDANVANRGAVLFVDDGTNEIFRVPQPTVAPASQTVPFTWVSGIGSQQGAANISGGLAAPLPDILLAPGFRIRTTTINIQATDNYGAPVFLVAEYTI